MALFKKKTEVIDINPETNDQQTPAPETEEKKTGLKNVLIGVGVGLAAAGGAALAYFKGRKSGYSELGSYDEEDDPDEDQVTEGDFEEEE